MSAAARALLLQCTLMSGTVQVAEAISQGGGQAISVSGDMLDPGFPAKLVQRAVEKFGALHILVNNAGLHAQDACTHDTDGCHGLQPCGCAGFTMDSMIHKMGQEQACQPARSLC